MLSQKLIKKKLDCVATLLYRSVTPAVEGPLCKLEMHRSVDAHHFFYYATFNSVPKF